MKKLQSYLVLALVLVLPISPLISPLSFSSGGPDGFEEVDLNSKEAWDNINNPLRLDPQFKKNLRNLPESGRVAQPPWSDSYWPSYQGGIAYRWNGHTTRTPFRYFPPSERNVQQMSNRELSALSPAEKYDIFMGNFSYPTVKREVHRTSSNNPKWYGICHGWSAATINFPYEPGPITLRGPSGISVPFGASDIKALLSYYQGEVTKAPTRFLGSRCEDRRRESRACRDTNAGTFHVVLANMIGLLGKSVVADLTRSAEVWNYPIVSFSSRLLNSRRSSSDYAAPGTVEEVEVKTDVTYATETDAHWSRIGRKMERKVFHYRLELNSHGEIIGGEWLQYDRPDFIWHQQKPAFSGYYSEIEKIYKSSLE